MAYVKYYHKMFLKIILEIILIFIHVKAHVNPPIVESNPTFLAPLDNITAAQGRDVIFTCIVNDLGSYRVAWIKSDTKAILAIHTHMVALNPRLSVTHNGHNTWKLHISNVFLNDSGSYMCQVNTDPMRCQSGYLEVVVPPDIIDDPYANNDIIKEFDQLKLECKVTGIPQPNVQWRREDNKDIVLRNETKQTVKHYDGTTLVLNNVHRTDMGRYLCIASNGVPPIVSKLFNVHVYFGPTVKAVTNVVAAPVGSDVTLQCIVEVFPKPLNTWHRGEDGQSKLFDPQKYIETEAMINSYTWQLNLTIKNLHRQDFGSYVCGSQNSISKDDKRIRLQELRLPIITTTTTKLPYIYTTVKIRRKQHQSHNNKLGHDSSTRNKDTLTPNLIYDNDILGSVIEVYTQNPGRSGGTGMDKTRNTQMPAAGVPSQGPIWIHNNGINYTTSRINLTILLISFFLIIALL